MPTGRIAAARWRQNPERCRGVRTHIGTRVFRGVSWAALGRRLGMTGAHVARVSRGQKPVSWRFVERALAAFRGGMNAFADVGQQHAVALRGEAGRDGQADAGGAAGDKDGSLGAHGKCSSWRD